MLRTIIMGSCVSVQGIFVNALSDGKITVRVGDKLYSGWPVSEPKAALSIGFV